MRDPDAVGLDAPRVHPADAVKLMVHHLQLAAMYFEAVPDEHAPSLAEMARQLNPDTTLPASREWFRVMAEAYAAMDH